MTRMLLVLAILTTGLCQSVVAQQRSDSGHETVLAPLPAEVIGHHVLDLRGRALRFTSTAGGLRLRDAKETPLTDLAFVAYQVEGVDAATRPVMFVFNGGPGMASAWLQMGALGPWRLRLDLALDGPSAAASPLPNDETWLDFTDLVFIDPPGTGFSRIVTADPEARNRLWSVGGDIEVLAQAVRRWLDISGRMVSPKYILGESYGGFRGPKLVQKLRSVEGVGVRGLILLSPLLDAHAKSGYADPMNSVDLLPSEVAVARAGHGPVTRKDMMDVESYAAGDFLVDMLRGIGDPPAVDRLIARVSELTGLDPALVRRLGGRLDTNMFQQSIKPGKIVSIYDGTIARANPMPNALDSQFPDPILAGLVAPVTTAMMAVYADKLKWRPDTVYHLSNEAAFGSWQWGHGIGRPESMTALQADRSVDPHLRVLIAHGLFDLVTPYFGTARMLRFLPDMPGSAPIAFRVYPGGHMFYFDDASRAALRNDAKAVFDLGDESGDQR